MWRVLWLSVALAGFWGPWLSLPPAALQLNAYELAEWVTFLPAVRWEGVPLNRLAFLGVSAGLAVLWALSATGAGWRGRALAAMPMGLCVWATLPYYPYILNAYAEPEFQLQFWVASSVGLGAGAWLMLAWGAHAQRLAHFLQLGMAGLTAFWAARALALALPQAQALLPSWGAGWGAALCLVALLALMVQAGLQLTQKAALTQQGGFGGR